MFIVLCTNSVAPAVNQRILAKQGTVQNVDPPSGPPFWTPPPSLTRLRKDENNKYLVKLRRSSSKWYFMLQTFA